jgi:hypothetical protein
MEMPRASFDTWVRKTRCLALEAGVVTIGTRNTYACEWLESRLASTVARLLAGMLNQAVEVRFVVDQTAAEGELAEADLEEPQETPLPLKTDPLEVEGRWESAYEQVVRPEKVIALNAYFIRHLQRLGPELGWMYIGFRQAAYSAGGRNGQRAARFSGKTIAALSGSSERTFWNRAARPETWQKLAGLVNLVDEKPLWDAKSPSPKRLPRKYAVAMTLPLTGADTGSLMRWIADHIEPSQGVAGVLAAACAAPLSELLANAAGQPTDGEPLTVHQLVRDLFSGALPDPELEAAAERLHLHIMPPGDLLVLTLFFVEHILPHLGAGPGWMLAILRDRCWINPETGTARSLVTLKGGYAEIAGWLGLDRPLTVYEWLSGKHRNFLPVQGQTPATGKKPNPKAGQYLNPVLRVYLREVETGRAQEFNTGPRDFEVLLNEIPTELLTAAIAGQEFFARISAEHSAQAGLELTRPTEDLYANYSIGVTRFAGDLYAIYSIGLTRFTEDPYAIYSIELTRFSEDLYAICRVFKLLNSLNPALNIKTSNPPAKNELAPAQNPPVTEKGVGVETFSTWDLETLLQNNGVRTRSQSELKKRGASAQALVSWLIYSATPAAARLTDPVGNAVARLLDAPQTGAGGTCNLLAALPPAELQAALEKDLRGGLVSTPGYALAFKQASADLKKELFQRLFGTPPGVGP